MRVTHSFIPHSSSAIAASAMRLAIELPPAPASCEGRRMLCRLAAAFSAKMSEGRRAFTDLDSRRFAPGPGEEGSAEKLPLPALLLALLASLS